MPESGFDGLSGGTESASFSIGPPFLTCTSFPVSRCYFLLPLYYLSNTSGGGVPLRESCNREGWMYSLILMSAVAAGPDSSAFGWRTASCQGCFGGVAASCYGCYGTSCLGSCTGCYGTCSGVTVSSSCQGCGGGLFSGGFLAKHRANRMARQASCSGCFGSSCFGSSCFGTTCMGCTGGLYYSTGCYGSCYGGCYGSCFGQTYVNPGFGCVGVVTGPVVSGYGQSMPGLEYTPGVEVPQADEPKPAPTPKAKADDEASRSIERAAPARLIIELPKDAVLLVDGQETRGEGDSRLFHTPVLPAGQAFFYEFRAEMLINGKMEVEEKRVVVRAGDDLTESFPKLIAAAADKSGTSLAAK